MAVSSSAVAGKPTVTSMPVLVYLKQGGMEVSNADGGAPAKLGTLSDLHRPNWVPGPFCGASTPCRIIFESPLGHLNQLEVAMMGTPEVPVAQNVRPIPVVLQGDELACAPEVSPLGNKLVFGGCAGGGSTPRHLWVMDAGNNGFLNGTVQAVHAAPDNDTGITWASFNPDGTKIAFCENGLSGDRLYILTLADNSIVQPSGWISSTGCSWIEWSPLGDKLAFSGINVYDFATGNTAVVAQGATPSWSANGLKIAYQSSITGGGVAVVNATGGNATLIVKGAVRPKFRKNLQHVTN